MAIRRLSPECGAGMLVKLLTKYTAEWGINIAAVPCTVYHNKMHVAGVADVAAPAVTRI